jgi:hypothetical protein
MNLEHVINPTIIFIYFSLFNDSISNSDYTATDLIIVNSEIERIWKDMS